MTYRQRCVEEEEEGAYRQRCVEEEEEGVYRQRCVEEEEGGAYRSEGEIIIKTAPNYELWFYETSLRIINI